MGRGEEKKKKVSGSRLRRLGRVGWLSRRAIPIALQRLRETGEPEPEEEETPAEFLEKHAEIANEAFRTLGDLKGLALKVGQMLSYMDGALPAQYRDVYQQGLAQLQATAPSLPWKAVEPVLVQELECPVAEAFKEFEPEPFAAASIGQVHRAQLHSGERVAVKVQYPGVDKAINSDLKNARLLQSVVTIMFGMGGRGTRKYIKEVMEEIRLRILEELDYEREARMQTRFRDLLADEPRLRIPKVFHANCSRRMLTTELIEGRTLQQVCDNDCQEVRNAYGEALSIAVIRCLLEFGLFNADPHPGNYLFPDDGTAVLLDFGCVKEIPDWMNRAVRRYVRAACIATRTDRPADWDHFDATIIEALKLDPDDEVIYRIYREFLLYLLRPHCFDGPFDFTPEFAGESIDRVLEAAKQTAFSKFKLPRIPKLPPVPPDYTFLNRLQWGFYSVLTMLRAQVNWHRLLPPEIRGDVPLRLD